MTGEAAGAAMLSAHAGNAAGLLLFRASDFRYLSENFVVDAPVEAAFAIGELYVNCGLSA